MERGTALKQARLWKKRIAFLLAVLMTVSLVQREGKTVLEDVYLSAANDLLLELTDETMPFYSGGQLYVSSKFFEGTDLGVRYVRNYSMGLAVLYTTKKDLRFDLVNLRVYDKSGVAYSGRAIEKGGVIFFPVELVCQYFGLRYSVTETQTVPLVRLKSDTVVLNDRSFVDAASTLMASRYAAYEKLVESSRLPDNPPSPPPIQAAEGQKVYLILAGSSADEIRAAMERLGEADATFLLTVQLMEDGDLLRTLLGSGHEVALMIQSTEESEIRGELERARELMWNAAFTLLQLVWYEGETDITGILNEQGCVSLTAELDRRGTPVRSQTRASSLLSVIGRYREDLSVYLGYDEACAGGLTHLVSLLREAKYRLCSWRLTAYMD